MKIAHIGSKGLPSKGGTERVVEAIVQRTAGEHEITVYCDARYTPRGTHVYGVRLVRVPTIRGKHVQAPWLFVLSSLHALLFCRYDLIHLHSVEASFVIPLLKIRFPVIVTAHGSPTRTPRSKWGRVARVLMGLTEYPYLFLPNLSTTVSSVDSDYCAKKYGRTPVYIPNGVGDLPKGCAQEDARVLEEHGLRPKEYLLFSAARIDPTKGCHLVIDAFGRLNRDTRLVVVGDLNQVPAYGYSLKKQANERVLFIPAVASKDRFMSVVRNCRLFVFPSLTEGMSMMLLEVASMGVPLVCSDIPENTSVLGDRAVYFKSRDVDDLATKIEWVLGNEEAVLKLADEARRWVAEEFSWDKIIRRYEVAYHRVVSNGPTSAKGVLSPGGSSGCAETSVSPDTTVAA